MKRFFVALLACALVFGVNDVQAQNKKKKSTKTTATTGKKKGTKTPAPEAPKNVKLPANSADCLFAIPLTLDQPYGPTSAPDGAGRIQEVVADKAHPNLFEREHNSVWYKVSIPYNGQLEISIVQQSQWDDYDFLVYKNTGSYFSNHVMLNKVLPVAVNIAGLDSAAMFDAVMNGDKNKKSAAAPKAKTPAKKKENADAPPAFQEVAGAKPSIGMFVDAEDVMLTKKDVGQFIKSIPVHAGEEYYIVLDNVTNNGQGHTITCSVHVNAFEPLVLFWDKKSRRYVDVNLMILEHGGNGGDRTLVKDEHYKGGRLKFVPGHSYLLYAKRDGYFSVYKEFSPRDYMEQGDTNMIFHMERTDRGSSFQIRNLDFEADGAELIGNYDSVLSDYVMMFRNHPEVNFLIKGYVVSYGVNAEADMLLSLDRAKSVKEFFVKNGIDAKRISTAGMTKNEIKRAAAAALSDNGGFSTLKCEFIVTGKNN